MEIVLNGNEFSNEEELHDYLKVKLQLPDYYGGNLNALWDCLTGWVDLPLTIVWVNFEESEKRLGSCAQEILDLFREAEEKLDGFKIRIG